MGVIVNFRGPAWFYGIDAVIQFFGAFIALILAIYGFKAYKLSGEKKYLLFGTAFLLLSLDLVIYAALIPGVFLYYSFYPGTYAGVLLQFARLLNFVFIAATLLAYTLLIAVYARLSRRVVIVLLSALVLTISAFIYRYQSFTGFNLVSVMLLIFIMAYTCNNCIAKKSRASLAIFFAFVLLALGHLFFVASGISPLAFLAGHILQLIGYLSLLIGLVFILGRKNAKKNTKAKQLRDH
tara:strand:+ start:438 stop:1151 length:714 start_codon:yes stop_codon:yes gene_type:complete